MNVVSQSTATAAEAVFQGQTVAGLFADVFELEAVGVDDDFFQLGGDSLMAESLMTAIEKRYGMVLSISVLLEAPTPRALAAAILVENASRAAPCLITIKDMGAPPAVFGVHGNVGELMAPLKLSESLGQHPFYAFRAIGLEQGEQFLTSTEAMATTYLTAIAKVRPTGSVVLFGHCAGAIIAYEMAQQLVSAGTPPAGLVLVDPEVSEDFAPYLHNSGLKLDLLQSSWRKRAAQLDAALKADPNPTGATRRKLVAGGIKHAVGTYTPKPYGGPTLLLYTPQRREALLNPERGFPVLVGDLETVALTVEHGDMFKKGLTQVADAIGRFIGRRAI